MGERPRPRPAVQRAPPRVGRADDGRGDREVPRLRPHQGDRPALRPTPRGCVRHLGVRRDRHGARAAPLGGRHRPHARRAHRRRLEGAEGRPRHHGLPALARRRHVARGADLQDLRPRRDRHHLGEPVPPRRRHPGHRLPHRGQDRVHARHREDGDDPGAGGHRLHAVGGDRRRALRTADVGADAGGLAAARHPRGAGGGGARPRARGRDGRPGHGERRRLRVPGEPARRRADHRGAHPKPRGGRRALEADRRGSRDSLGRGAAVDVARADAGRGAPDGRRGRRCS